MKRSSMYLKAALDLLMPRTCIVCGRRLNRHERHLCLYCLADFPFTFFWKAGYNPMSDKFNETIQKRLEEEAGHDSPHERYAFAVALFYYHSEAGYRHIPYQVKYHGNTPVGRHFGAMLGRKILEAEFLKDVDMIIPVPLHWMRRWSRGYNQAEIIASGISRETGIPMRTDILRRHRRTRTQTVIKVEEKARNVSQAFSIRNVPCQDIRHILLVDDVFTTGSTLSACLQALRTVFPPSVRISVATLGFVGGA